MIRRALLPMAYALALGGGPAFAQAVGSGGGAGGGTPGGSSGQIQCNSSSAFAGIAATDTQLLIAQVSGCPTGQTLSGDATLADTGALTVADNAVTTTKINNAAVTLAKIANAQANSKLLGSGATGSGAAYTELTLGTNLSMSGTTLNAAGGGSGCTVSGTVGQVVYNDGASGCLSSTATITSAGNVLIASPTANSYAISITGGSVTSGTAGFGRNTTGAVNDASAVDGIVDFANITCTVCTATSYLVDWQVGGASQFRVTTGGLAQALSFQSTSGGITSAGGVTAASTGQFSWSGRGIVTSPGSGAVQVGAADAASPVAQTLSVQSVVAGTSNTAGQDVIVQASRGTGTGAGGSILFRVAPAGSTGTAQNALATAFTISGKGVPVVPSFTVANLPASPLTGSLAIVSDANAACTFGGAPTGGGSTVCKVWYNGAAWVEG